MWGTLETVGNVRRVGNPPLLLLSLCPYAFAQLNQNCTVSVLNRTVLVNPDTSASATW